MAQVKELNTPKKNLANLMNFIQQNTVKHLTYLLTDQKISHGPPPPRIDKHDNHMKLRNYEPTEPRNCGTKELQLELHMKPRSLPSKKETHTATLPTMTIVRLMGSYSRRWQNINVNFFFFFSLFSFHH